MEKTVHALAFRFGVEYTSSTTDAELAQGVYEAGIALLENLEAMETTADLAFGAGQKMAGELIECEEKLEMMERALKMREWQPVHDPDTNELLGQLCLWCNRKPHSIHCERQKALKE